MAGKGLRNPVPSDSFRYDAVCIGLLWEEKCIPGVEVGGGSPGLGLRISPCPVSCSVVPYFLDGSKQRGPVRSCILHSSPSCSRSGNSSCPFVIQILLLFRSWLLKTSLGILPLPPPPSPPSPPKKEKEAPSPFLPEVSKVKEKEIGPEREMVDSLFLGQMMTEGQGPYSLKLFKRK